MLEAIRGSKEVKMSENINNLVKKIIGESLGLIARLEVLGVDESVSY